LAHNHLHRTRMRYHVSCVAGEYVGPRKMSAGRVLTQGCSHLQKTPRSVTARA